MQENDQAVIEPASSQEEFDVVISFVLFHQDVAEIDCAVRQALSTSSRALVMLVDNSVPSLTLPDFPEHRVKIFRTGANLGYGRAHNIAIRAAQGMSRYHLVMNTDVTYDGTVIDELVAFMDGSPEVGLTMPKVYYTNGQLQTVCRLLPSPIDLIGRRFFGWTQWNKARNRRYEFHDWGYDSVASFPFLSGCFMLMRRSILEQVGGFDERFFLYAEDLDLSRRMHMVSETLFYPHVEIVHLYRSEQSRSWRRTMYGLHSLAQYFTKWGWLVDRDRAVINERAALALREEMSSK